MSIFAKISLDEEVVYPANRTISYKLCFKYSAEILRSCYWEGNIVYCQFLILRHQLPTLCRGPTMHPSTPKYQFIFVCGSPRTKKLWNKVCYYSVKKKKAKKQQQPNTLWGALLDSFILTRNIIRFSSNRQLSQLKYFQISSIQCCYKWPSTLKTDFYSTLHRAKLSNNIPYY